jgi:hypothetical protein
VNEEQTTELLKQITRIADHLKNLDDVFQNCQNAELGHFHIHIDNGASS